MGHKSFLSSGSFWIELWLSQANTNHTDALCKVRILTCTVMTWWMICRIWTMQVWGFWNDSKESVDPAFGHKCNVRQLTVCKERLSDVNSIDPITIKSAKSLLKLLHKESRLVLWIGFKHPNIISVGFCSPDWFYRHASKLVPLLAAKYLLCVDYGIKSANWTRYTT